MVFDCFTPCDFEVLALAVKPNAGLLGMQDDGMLMGNGMMQQIRNFEHTCKHDHQAILCGLNRSASADADDGSHHHANAGIKNKGGCVLVYRSKELTSGACV